MPDKTLVEETVNVGGELNAESTSDSNNVQVAVPQPPAAEATQSAEVASERKKVATIIGNGFMFCKIKILPCTSHL